MTKNVERSRNYSYYYGLWEKYEEKREKAVKPSNIDPVWQNHHFHKEDIL